MTERNTKKRYGQKSKGVMKGKKIIHNKSKEVMDGHAEKIPKNVYVAEITVVRERPIDGDASL